MKIIICDDDMFTMKYMKQLFEEAAKKDRVTLEFSCLASGAAEVLKYIEKNEDNFVFFLDLDLGSKKMNGIDLAVKIRQLRPYAKIIFITSHSEKTIEILKSGVEPFGYIEKDLNQNLMIRDIRITLRKLIEISRTGETDPQLDEKKLKVLVGIDEYMEIPFNQIIHIDTNKQVPHNICIYTAGGSVLTMRDTIEHMRKELDERFRCCHRSVIVNVNQIIKVTSNSLILSNGEEVPLSLSNRKFFRLNEGDASR